MKFEFSDFDITLREILFSIIIFCLVLCLGIFINNKIDEHFTIKEEKYNKALKIDNDNEQFAYALNTSVGNLINYGKFKVIDSVSDDWLINSYTAYEKITERYTRHTRTVCTGSGKTRHCHTETYHTWDRTNSEEKFANEISFSQIKFSTSNFTDYPWQRLDISDKTISKNAGYLKNGYIYKNKRWISSHVGDLRYYYKIVPTEFYGTTFGVAKNKTYFNEDGKQISIHQQTLQEYLESNKQSKGTTKIIFWITYLIIIGVGIFAFYYKNNDWLEN